MPQEFLASFAVDIDEGGANRLKSILEENRSLAGELAAAFDAARASVEAFIREVSEVGNPGSSNETSGRAGYVTPLPYRAEGVRGQVQDMFNGLIAPEGDSSLRSWMMRSEEIAYAGIVSRDSSNYLRQNLAGRPTREDFGVPEDYQFSWDSEDLSYKVKDIMMEPVERARTVMKEAIDAEAAGEDTTAYVEQIREIIEKPMQQVRELYESLDLGSYDTSNETSLADALKAQMDFSDAEKSLDAFIKKASEPIKLSANASQIVSAASSALSQARSLIEGTTLTLHVKEELDSSDIPGGDSDSSGSSGSGASVRLAAGGRYSSPTHAEIAEDGDPEYVVPVRKENEAVPLVRSLLSELSGSARESLRDVLPSEDFPNSSGGESLSGYASAPELLSGTAAAVMPVIQQTSSSNVQAPVNIHVEAAASDPEAVGRSIYDTAERYLLRTLQGVC